MKTIYSEKHRLRDAKTELYGGQLVPPFERPSRADMILKAVRASNLGPVEEPVEHGLLAPHVGQVAEGKRVGDHRLLPLVRPFSNADPGARFVLEARVLIMPIWSLLEI